MSVETELHSHSLQGVLMDQCTSVSEVSSTPVHDAFVPGTQSLRLQLSQPDAI